MPFNGSGTFTIVNTFVPNTTILSAAVNQNFTDIATGLSDCLTRDGQAGMTAAFKAIAGSLASPSISFTSDATSGLYLSASGILGYVSHSLGMLLNTTIYNATSAAVQSGGSGYAVGDTITISGGTSGASLPAVFTVATLSGSAVSTVTVAFPGFYSVTGSNPASQSATSGIGTGCTLNVTYNNPAGSDYRAFFSDQAGGTLWQKFGASSFTSGLMKSANALAFAQGIGSSALTAVIGNSFLLPPQGILTLSSSTTSPVPTGDIAGSILYWTPFRGNVVPIYNGTQFIIATSSQLACTLTAGAQVLGGIYDVYMFLNAGTPTLGFSPSWAAGTSGSVTLGSCARGTGAGGTALSVINGLYVNTVSMTVNNGATTYTIPANQGTYLGTIYISSTAGQINCYRAWGQARVWGVFNAYNNRYPVTLLEGDTLNTAYTTATFRAYNNDPNNKVTVIDGLGILSPNAIYVQRAGVSLGSGQIAIGLNGVNPVGQFGFISTSAASPTISAIMTATYTMPPALGISSFTACEYGSAAGGLSLTGTQISMQMTVQTEA